MSESRNQGTYEHYTSAQSRTALQKLVALQVTDVDIVSLKCHFALFVSGYTHSNVLEQLNLIVDIRNVRQVAYPDWVAC
jgi:hypothetical protein